MTEPSLSDRYELPKAHVGWTVRDAGVGDCGVADD